MKITILKFAITISIRTIARAIIIIIIIIVACGMFFLGG